jgi:hypothetical protein
MNVPTDGGTFIDSDEWTTSADEMFEAEVAYAKLGNVTNT